MAAGYPVKVNYLTGDVLTAGDLNDLAGTVNLYDPTAKGDLFPATAADAVSRLAVGANDTVLTADSATATGMKWAAGAGGGGMTSIATGSLSGNSVVISSISQSYKDLMLVIKGVQSTTAQEFWIRVDNDSGANYRSYGATSLSVTAEVTTTISYINGTDLFGNSKLSATYTKNFASFTILDYTNSTNKIVQKNTAYQNNSAVDVGGFSVTNYTPASPTGVTSIGIHSNGYFDGGTYILYGVS